MLKIANLSPTLYVLKAEDPKKEMKLLTKLYELILSHGNPIFPYLEMRAVQDEQTKSKTISHSINVPCNRYNEKTLSSYADIGLIRYATSGSNRVIIELSEGSIFEENFRYLCDPPLRRIKKEPAKAKPSYKDKTLNHLVCLAGYPSDWVKNPSKYSILFRKALSKHGLETLEGFAKYLNTLDDKDARSLFTESYIASYKSGSLSKGDPKDNGFYKSREEENYTEGEDF